MNGNGRINLSTLTSTILGVTGVFSVFIGVLFWGLKLDTRVQDLTTRVSKLEAKVDPGILSVAKTRVDSLEKRLDKVEKEMKE